MRLNLREILNYRVQTESGDCLGKISDIKIDLQYHEVKNYLSSSNGLLTKNKRFFIPPEQIIKLDYNRKIMIVKDALINNRELGKTPNPATDSAPVLNCHGK